MPKVFLNDLDRSCHRFAVWVRGQGVSDTKLANEYGISQSAMSRKFRVEQFDIKDFVFFAKKFHMDKETFDYIIGN